MHSIQWLVFSSQPKDSIDITLWFILGIVLSAFIWVVCVCIMNSARLRSIESFITNEFKYNRDIIKTLRESPESLTKIQRLEYIHNLKQIGKTICRSIGIFCIHSVHVKSMNVLSGIVNGLNNTKYSNS